MRNASVLNWYRSFLPKKVSVSDWLVKTGISASLTGYYCIKQVCRTIIEQDIHITLYYYYNVITIVIKKF